MRAPPAETADPPPPSPPSALLTLPTLATRIVGGRFRLEREAGSGGMGTVYCAVDLTTGEAVAVKILNGRELRDRRRFEQEAAILAELSHPAIVRYLAHGVDEEGDPFLAMEWLDGEDLAARIGRQDISIAEALFVIRRAAEGLGYAHGRGIIHRDVKPENLFLPSSDIERLKVLDFGIARLTEGGRTLTRTGAVVGTPGYMAPELVRGERIVTACADVFSLGCVLFQCLTGRPVFEAEEASALLAKILLQDAPRVRELVPRLPESIDDMVARMLAKEPAARLQDMAAVLDALDALGEIADVGPAARRPRSRAALTTSEQRIACVVLAGPSASDERRWRGRTLRISPHGGDGDEESDVAPPISMIEVLEAELATAHGARVHPLPDGSMVLTLPDAGKSTDQAASAARCALRVRASFPDVGLVIATGPGRVSAWSVVGEVIDSGMRLLRCTPPGSIRLDDMAAGLLDARFEIHRDGGQRFLRGERDVFEVKRNLLGRVSEFVGRGREISTLTNLFSSTAAEAIASAVLVTGPTGAGKSRLRQEFVEWVQRRPGRTEVLFGVGDSLGVGSPFGMLDSAIRRSAGIQSGDSLEEKRRKLTARVARHVDPDAVTRVASFLGEMTGIAYPDDDNGALQAARQNPQLMGDGMRRAWEDWLAAECAAGPVLIVLEDLHWADGGTVSFIDGALRNFREQPLMVLALARSDVHSRFADLWKDRELQTIRLSPLPRRAAEKLVRAALRTDVGEATVKQIIDRADGNAFCLEELIRAAADGRCELLPDTVIGLVQSRLDAEDPYARRILRAASIFGDRFSRAGVSFLLGGESAGARVGDWLDLLCARELLARVPVAEPRSAGDIDLTFAHGLVREAAYAMLTDEDRPLGHRLAGDWLEQKGSSDAMAVAEHFRLGDEPGRSVAWYLRAAEQALKANNLGAAIERAELGMAGGAAGEQAGALRLIQAEGHVWRGELALAERRALDAAGSLPPGSAPWLRALAQAVVAAAKLGKLDEVEAQVREVSRVVPDFGARSAQIICLSWGANYLMFGGRHAVADEIMAIIGELAGDLSEIDLQAVALVHQVRSVRASIAGDLGACLSGLDTALVAFERAGDLRNACTIRCNMGYLYCELGDFERAEVALRHAQAAADRMGLRELAAAILHNLGRVLGLRGNLDEARRLEQQAVDSFVEQGEQRLEGVARTYLAEILVAAGDYEVARGEAERAVDLLSVAPSLRVAALGAVARSLLALGMTEQAMAMAREAIAELAALGEIEEGEAAVRLAFVECLDKSGAADEARTASTAAREWLVARAARISEPSWRSRFLSQVPTNAKILASEDARIH